MNSSINQLLANAVSQLRPCPDRKPWNYGWQLDSYRHSGQAALAGFDGPVTLNEEGIEAYELATQTLLRERSIGDRWEAEEFWGLLGSLIVAASQTRDPLDFIERSVNHLRSVGPALTVTLIANVSWEGPPIAIGEAVVGYANPELIAFINSSAAGRCTVDEDEGSQWLVSQVQPRLTAVPNENPVALATWSVGQSNLAYAESDRQLRNIVDLCVMLERDLRQYKVYRRGGINRPGTRGLTIDRGAVERGLSKASRLELASQPLITSSLNMGRQSVRWYSAEPLPLGVLLRQPYLSDAVRACTKDDPIYNRLRVAARWFAEAFYTEAPDDAALALGVALDALLSGQQSLSGSVMADRFAFLSEHPDQRRERVKTYLELYGVRSSVAHGGQSSKLSNNAFLGDYQAAVHWAAWRLLALRESFAPKSPKEVDELFNDLRWGAVRW